MAHPVRLRAGSDPHSRPAGRFTGPILPHDAPGGLGLHDSLVGDDLLGQSPAAELTDMSGWPSFCPTVRCPLPSTPPE